jgi:hypothetical protein
MNSIDLMPDFFSIIGASAAPASTASPVSVPCCIVSVNVHASLLGIPPELRLLVYDYMSLWPSVGERKDWGGVYNSCRKIQYEMAAHVTLEKDIARNLNRLRAHKIQRSFTFEPTTSNEQCPITIDPVFSASSPHLMRGITIILPFHLIDEFPHQLLQSIYELYLDHVTVTLKAEVESATAVRWRSKPLLPYGDLKSLAPQAFESHVHNKKMNCKKITILIPHLASLTHGYAKEKSTDLDMEIKYGGHRIPYTLTIVQNSMEKQVEKTFFSPTRFRPMSEGGMVCGRLDSVSNNAEN